VLKLFAVFSQWKEFPQNSPRVDWIPASLRPTCDGWENFSDETRRSCASRYIDVYS